MEINWTKYLDLYPDRYIKESKIDSRIKQLLNYPFMHEIETLDIGGNIDGTDVLKGTKCYFLDPYVNKPNWCYEKINWNDLLNKKYKFDIIVAKNSLNYLTERELKIIPESLKTYGTFIANTFIYPKEIDREFVNSKTGIKGTEKTT